MWRLAKALLVGILAAAAPLLAQPTISNVYVSAATSTTATFTWTTNTPSTSQVRYGFDISLPFNNNPDSNLVTTHTMTLTFLQPSTFYYFAVVSADSGGNSSQSATSSFSLCSPGESGIVPVQGTANNFYMYGTFTLTWVPPAGSSGTPMICGQPMATTATGSLDGGASLSSSVADSYKAIPGPGTWHVAVTDYGNIAPVGFNFPISTQSNNVSTPLKAAANASGLKFCLSTGSALFPSDCGGGGGSPLVVEINGTPISPSSPADFVDTSSVHWTFSGGTIQAAASGGSGALPAAPAYSGQFANATVTAFQADQVPAYGVNSAYNYNPLTHVLGVNAVNGLGFISPSQTSGGDGQAAFFSGKTNAFGIIDNLELVTGQVSGVTGTGGTGMTPGTYSLSFSGGGGGSGAAGLIDVLTATTYVISVSNPGTGYTSAPTVTAATGGTPPALTATIASASDPAQPPGSGNMIFDFRTITGTFGVRSTNCVANNTIESSLGQPDSPCLQSVVYDNDPTATRDPLFLGLLTYGQGRDVGNQGALANSDQGWTNSGALNLGFVVFRPGIKGGLTLVNNCPSQGDCNDFSAYNPNIGWALAASDEGQNGFRNNSSDSSNGRGYVTATVNTVPSPGQPTYSNVSGDFFKPGGILVDTTQPSLAFSITSQSTSWNAPAVLSMNIGPPNGQGSGQTPSLEYTVSSVATSSGGTTTYTGTFPGCTANNFAGQYWSFQNFNGNFAIGGPNNGIYLVASCTTTTMVANNPHAVAATSAFGVAIQNYQIACSGGGGTGLVAVASVGPGGNIGVQPAIVDPGSGYTSAPTGCAVTGTGGTPATFGASLQSPMGLIPITGITLTPSTGQAVTLDYISAAQLPTPMTNVSSVVRVRVENSLPITTGYAWFIDPTAPELCAVTNAPAAVSGIQTLTVSCHQAHANPNYVTQGSTPACLWPDANYTQYGFPECYDLFGAPDSSHLWGGFTVKGALVGNGIPRVGNEWADVTTGRNPANATYHAYQATHILYDSAGTGFNPVLNVSGINFTSADAIFGIGNPSVTYKGISMSAVLNTPINGGGSQTAVWGAQGQHVSQGFIFTDTINGNNFGYYQGCGSGSTQFVCVLATPGGPLIGPIDHNVVGAFQIGNHWAQPPIPGGSLIDIGASPTPYTYGIVSPELGNVGNFNVCPSCNAFQFTNNLEIGNNTNTLTLTLRDSFGSGTNTTFLAVNLPPEVVFLDSVSNFDNMAEMSGLAFIGSSIYAGGQQSGALIVSPNTGGSTTWCYTVTSVTPVGESKGLSPICTNAGAVTPNNSVNFSAATPGVHAYNVYRVANGAGCTGCGGTGPAGALARNTTANQVDTGTLVDSGLPPTADTSGIMYTPQWNQASKTFGISGAGHGIGLVPDPGSTSGATRFLREDGTWDVPGGGGGGGCGPLAGDATSTNCGNGNLGTPPGGANNLQAFGTNNLNTDTPAEVVAFGSSNANTNHASELVAIGDTNATAIATSSADVIGIGNNNVATVTGSIPDLICIGDGNCQTISWLQDSVGIGNANFQNNVGVSSSTFLSEAVAIGLGNVGFINNGATVIGIGQSAAGGCGPSQGDFCTGQHGSNNINDVISIGDSSGNTIGSNVDDVILIGDGVMDSVAPSSSDIIGIGDAALQECEISGSSSCASLSIPTPTAMSQVIGIGTLAGAFDQGSNIIAIGLRTVGGGGSASPITGNSGTFNIGIGDNALAKNTTGSNNVALGPYAGADGYVFPSTFGNSNKTGSNNTWIGYDSGPNTTTQLSNTIALGYTAHNTASNQIVIGNSSITQSIMFGSPQFPTIAPGSVSCLQIDASGNVTPTGSGCGGGGGSGTVTNFIASSGSWPSWLTPSVATSTTTPTLSVTASAIPNSALANASTTVNGVTCTLGSTCTISASVVWSSIGNPTGNLSLTMGANTSTFAFGATSGSADLFNIHDAASDTGTGIMFHITTGSGSTEIPWQVDANGVGFKITPTGILQGVGSATTHALIFASSSVAATPSSGEAIYTSDSSGNAVGSSNGSALQPFLMGTFPWSCQPGLGDGSNAITGATYPQTNCYNDTGKTVTLTGIKCFTDNNGSSTLNATNGGGTGLLTGAITCTTSFAAGSQSGTTTIAAGDYIKFSFVADGTSKQATFVVTGTHP
jgi:hypothetical protein